MPQFVDVERSFVGPRVLAKKSWISKRMLGHKFVMPSWEKRAVRDPAVNYKMHTIEKKLMTKLNQKAQQRRKEFERKRNTKELKKFHAAFKMILILFVVCICLLVALTVFQTVQQKMSIDY